MDISELGLHSPGPVAEQLTDQVLSASTVAVYGRAKGLHHFRASTALRRLWISGVEAAAADVLGGLSRLEALVIQDLRIADLHAFASLDGLRELAIAGSPKLKSLSGLERMRGLKRLILFDNCNYPDIAALAALTEVETLCLEGGFSKQLRLPTLEPLVGLRNLRRLRLASVRVADGSLRPLLKLAALQQVFINKGFPPSEFRTLAAALPNARGEFLDTFRDAG